MNYITIEKSRDFQELLDVDILITGDVHRHKEEWEYNTWNLSFDVNFIKSLTRHDLNTFIYDLIKNRKQQVVDLNNGPATFYMWYDEQSLNLCFDILTGTNISLPFGCELNILNTFDSILDKFFVDVQPENNPLSWDKIIILEPGDEGFGDDDDDEIDWIQDVYVTTLP